MTWFTSGAQDHNNDAQNERSSGGFDARDVFRWFIPKSAIDETKKLIFLNDEPFNCWMHHYEKDGRWGNWETCIRRTGASKSCPLCERDGKVYTAFIGHYTVIDVSGWEKDGKHKMAIKILAAKSERVQLLEKERERRGSLIGAKFDVERTKDSKDNTGNFWSYVDRVNLDEFLKDNFLKLKDSLDYFPEDWGFWSGSDKSNKRYFLNKGLPFEKILNPLTYEELAVKSGSSSSHGQSGGFSANTGNNAGTTDPSTDGGFSYNPQAPDVNPGY